MHPERKLLCRLLKYKSTGKEKWENKSCLLLICHFGPRKMLASKVAYILNWKNIIFFQITYYFFSYQKAFLKPINMGGQKVDKEVIITTQVEDIKQSISKSRDYFLSTFAAWLIIWQLLVPLFLYSYPQNAL